MIGLANVTVSEATNSAASSRMQAEFQIERFIQKMQQDIAILNNKNIIPTEVGIACGYALATPDDADIEKVRERADEMMYHNKKVLKGLI